MNRQVHAPPRARHRADPRRSALIGGLALLILGIALVGGVARVASARLASDPGRVFSTDISHPLSTPASSPAGTTRPPPPAPPDPTGAVAAAPAPPPPTRRERVRIPSAGPATFDVVGGASSEGSTTLTYTVEIERRLPFAPRATASIMDATLTDERGWVAVRGTTFRRVASSADLRILVASPDTTDRLCAPLATRGRVSCRNGELVVLNARRWAFGVPQYRRSLGDYRRYLVNHKIGHALGEHHDSCPGPRQPAPVMLQQTYGLDGCRRNPWPEVA